jgi:signal peptidase I
MGKQRRKVSSEGYYTAKSLSVLNKAIILLLIAALVAVWFLPILRIYKNVAGGVLQKNDVTVVVEQKNYKKGDFVAINRNGGIMIGWVAACEGEIVDVNGEGFLTINDELPVFEIALNRCRPILSVNGDEGGKSCPTIVPERELFVLSCYETGLVGSQFCKIGCIPYEKVIGKIILRVWPVSRIGLVK